MALMNYLSKEETSKKHHLELTRKKIKLLKDRLYKKLGYKRLLEISKQDEAQARSELKVVLEALVNSPDLVDEQFNKELIEDVIDEIIGLGPLESLLKDDSITEIMINGTQSMFYEQGGKLYELENVFSSDEQIKVLIDRIIAPLGRRVDEASPLVNARLANGYRVNVVISPIALDGSVVTIRKFSDRISSLQELIKLKSIPQKYAQLLSWAVVMRKNIAVVGSTGSGKTTLLNALSCEIPYDERIITIEDSAELRFKDHPHVVRLERRDKSIEGVGEVSIRDLVINALRMRPDRIVVGECRGAETIDMLQAMNTGHDGSLTTLHAGSPEEAIVRLVLMSRYGINLPADVIEDQIATALDLIVMQARIPSGERRVTDLCLVERKDTGGVGLKKIISYHPESDSWTIEHIPDFINTLIINNIAEKEEVEAWKNSSFS
ncbi:MAG: CpaF family protein [Coriobacteriia bacterium]|nr:CpaF family protein [Coriobacteriia bacterium]